MKRGIDRMVYANTLEFLAGRIGLYERCLAAASEDPAKAAKYKSILDSCIDIRETFVRMYKPRRASKREAEASGKEKS